MNDQIKHSNNGKSPLPDEEMLLKYLKGELSLDEQYAIEQQIDLSDFEQDAIEGLSQVTDHNKLNNYVSSINKQISSTLKEKKYRKRRPLPSMSWIYLALFIVLSLLILAYIVVHFLVKHQ